MKERVAAWLRTAKEYKLESLARLISIGMGGWLVVSAFLWRDPHQSPSAGITGLLVALCALAAWVKVPWLRLWNAAFAVWLFFSPILLPYRFPAMAVNEMLVSLVVLVCSFLPLISVSVDEGTPLVPAHET